MKCNIDKCSILQMSYRQNKSSFAYSKLGLPLKTTEQHIYLGVQSHHKLSWHSHVNYIWSKTNRLLGVLQQNLYNLVLNLSESKATTSTSLNLDYCSTIIDHTTNAQSTRLKCYSTELHNLSLASPGEGIIMTVLAQC